MLKLNSLKIIQIANKCGVTDDYQHQVILDTSQYIIINKARGIGISTAFAFKALIRSITGLSLKVGGESIMISQSEEQAEHLILYVQNFWDIINDNIKLPINILNSGRGYIRFSNKTLLLSLPNKPSAVRTYHGDVYIDEYAHFFNNDKEIITATSGILSSGGTLMLTSTPFGERGEFWRIWEKETNYKKYKMPYTICNRKNYRKMVESEQKRLDPITFTQEYKCGFIAEGEKPFPHQLILRQVDKDLKINEYINTENLIFGGTDFAKIVDETGIILLEKIKDILVVRWIESMSQIPYSEQLEYIERLFETWKINLMYIDKTVVGIPLEEELSKKIGSRIVGYNFNSQSKEALFMLVKTKLMDKKLFLPNNEKLIYQMTRLERRITSFGNIQYGHPEGEMDDLFWALALAVRASEDTNYNSEFSYRLISKKPTKLRDYARKKWQEAYK